MKTLKINHLSILITTFCMLLAFSMFFSIKQAEAKAQGKGTMQALVLMVDFSDKPGQVQRTYFQDLMFGTKPAIAPLGSFTDYYTEVSYSQLSISGLVNDGITDWYRMPQTYSYYVNNQYGFGAYPQNTQKLVEDAVAAAKAAGLNFGPYDNDNDGYVDALFIIHAGQGAEFTGCTCDIWSHYLPFDAQTAININTGSVNAKGNKVYVRDYTFQPEYFTSLNDMTIGVYSHEFGHVLGLPDLYDTGSDGTKTQGIGRWSLMAGGSWNGTNGLGDSPAHPDAWSKKKLVWVKPTPSTSGTISILQVETNKSIHKLCSNTPGQYFLLENRQRSGFDFYLPSDGLAIYHIDESINSNDNEWYPKCTTCGSHYKVALEQADGRWDLEKNINPGDTGDLYPGVTNNTSFTATSTPNSKNYSGQKTGVSISKISASNATMTATVSASSTNNTYNYIADTYNNRIQIFRDGTFVSKFGTWGSAPGQFIHPSGVAVDESRIYVADTVNNWVQVFTKNGNFIFNFGPGPGALGGYVSYPPWFTCAPDAICGPTRIAVDDSQIYVTSEGEHRVLIFTKDGRFVTWFGPRTISGQLGEPGTFNYPNGIAVDDSYIYVADSGNNRIQIFTKNGTFVSKFGTYGSAPGQFNMPYDLAVDESYIYVADSTNHRIQIFTKSGTFVSKFGTWGSASGQFSDPRGISVDECNIFVADSANNRIQIFTKDGNFISKFGRTGSGSGRFDWPLGIANK